jgi:hypothetical protein
MNTVVNEFNKGRQLIFVTLIFSTHINIYADSCNGDNSIGCSKTAYLLKIQQSFTSNSLFICKTFHISSGLQDGSTFKTLHTTFFLPIFEIVYHSRKTFFFSLTNNTIKIQTTKTHFQIIYLFKM